MSKEKQLADWVNGEEWQTIRGKLTEYMNALESVHYLDIAKTNEEVGQEAKVRSKALRLVESWISDVETIPIMYNQNVQVIKEETYVITRE